MVVHIKQTDPFFISSTLGRPVAEESRVLTSRIKRQMENSVLTRSMLSASESAKDLVNGSVVGSIISNIFLSGGMSVVVKIMGMINSL